jgi:hypothetical protein
MFSYAPKAGVLEPTKNHTSNLTVSGNIYDIRYRSNGSGRDGYIHFNNGGMTAQYQPSKGQEPSGRFLPKISPNRGMGDVAKPVGYRSDGSGRDHYVTSSNGGFTSV